MSEKTYELLVQILAAQVLTMQSLIAIEEHLFGRHEREPRPTALTPLRP